jgi:glutathione S-transferase
MLGSNPKETAQVEQWTSWAFTTLKPTVDRAMLGVFGANEVGLQIQQSAFKEAQNQLKAEVKRVNDAIQGGFLVEG